MFVNCLLISSDSVQEMSQMQIKLQQAQSAKALSENMNKVLQVCFLETISKTPYVNQRLQLLAPCFCFVFQEDLADLKEQITLYESAVKHGVVPLDLSSESENHLSESCVGLGLKKATGKNGTFHRYASITAV